MPDMASNGTAGAQGGAGTTNNGGTGSAAGAGGSYTVQHGGAGSGAGGQGAGGGAGSGEFTSDRERRAVGAQNIVDRLVHRYGSTERALDVLAGENFDAREERRRLAEENGQLRAQLPPNGAVVLVGDDAKAWEGFKGLNLPADKLRERLTLADTLERERQGQQLGTLAEQAATAYGWNSAALAELVQDKQLQVELRDVLVQNGAQQETRKVPFARKASDSTGHFVPLQDYVQQHHAVYLPALQHKPAAGGTAGTPASGAQGGVVGTAGNAGTTTQPPAPQGAATGGNVVVFTDQSSGAHGGPANPVDAMLAANRAAASKPNPLRKAAPSAPTT